MALKKLAVGGLICILLLNGCSNNKQTSSDNALATVNQESIYANDVYIGLLNNSTAKQTVFQKIFIKLVEQNYPVTEAMKTDAELQIKQLKDAYTSYYGGSGETYLLSAIQNQGYNSIEQYQEMLVYSYQLTEFLEAYVTANFDEIFDDYYELKSPRYVSHVLIKMEDSTNPTEEELAKVEEVQKLINEGKPFADIATSYSDDSSASSGGSLGFADADSSFVTEFLTAMLALDEGEISGVVVSEYGYHFIKIDSTDKETIKNDDQITKAGTGKIYTYDSYLSYVAFSSYDITYQNETIEKIVNEILTIQFDARSKLREGGND